MSTGYAVLQTLHKNQDEIYPKLERNCEELKKVLVDLTSTYHIEAQVNNIASMFQIFFASHPITDYVTAKSSDTKKFSIYFRELLKQGIFIPPSQFETCFLSTAHSKDDLESTIEAVDNALRKVSTEGGSV